MEIGDDFENVFKKSVDHFVELIEKNPDECVLDQTCLDAFCEVAKLVDCMSNFGQESKPFVSKLINWVRKLQKVIVKWANVDWNSLNNMHPSVGYDDISWKVYTCDMELIGLRMKCSD